MGSSSDSSDSETDREIKKSETTTSDAPANGASTGGEGLPVDEKAVTDAIAELIKTQGLETLTSAKIRGHLSALFAEDFNPHRKTVDEITRKEIEKFQTSQQKATSSATTEKDVDSDESDSDHGIASRDVPRKKVVKTKAHVSDDDDEGGEEMDLMTRVKSRRRAATKLPERRPRGPPAKKPKKKKGGPSKKGYGKLCALSDELAAIVGKKFMPRHNVLMWAYFREHDLMDPKDRRMVIPDEKLKAVFKNRFAAFSMMKVLRNHIKDPELLGEDVAAAAEEERRRLVKEAALNDDSESGSDGDDGKNEQASDSD